jgi:hypothetical protein
MTSICLYKTYGGCKVGSKSKETPKSKIEWSYWLRAKSWIQGVYTRICVMKILVKWLQCDIFSLPFPIWETSIWARIQTKAREQGPFKRCFAPKFLGTNPNINPCLHYLWKKTSISWTEGQFTWGPKSQHGGKAPIFEPQVTIKIWLIIIDVRYLFN